VWPAGSYYRKPAPARSPNISASRKYFYRLREADKYCPSHEGESRTICYHFATQFDVTRQNWAAPRQTALRENPSFSGLFDTEQNQTIWLQTNFKTGALNYSATLPSLRSLLNTPREYCHRCIASGAFAASPAYPKACSESGTILQFPRPTAIRMRCRPNRGDLLLPA
jgi:hypothetical protein